MSFSYTMPIFIPVTNNKNEPTEGTSQEVCYIVF